MSRTDGGTREIAVPISVFGSLRAELEHEAGMLPTVRALHRAGYYAGLAAATTVNQETGGDSLALSQSGFWATLSEYFSGRGWGTMDHRAPHAGVGLLSSPDWAEARTDEIRPDASCSFSAGFLSGLLSQLFGGAVAVLEIGCRMRGEASCDFAFGSETAIYDLYGHLLDGADFDTALDAL